MNNDILNREVFFPRLGMAWVRVRREFFPFDFGSCLVHTTTASSTLGSNVKVTNSSPIYRMQHYIRVREQIAPSASQLPEHCLNRLTFQTTKSNPILQSHKIYTRWQRRKLYCSSNGKRCKYHTAAAAALSYDFSLFHSQQREPETQRNGENKRLGANAKLSRNEK